MFVRLTCSISLQWVVLCSSSFPCSTVCTERVTHLHTLKGRCRIMILPPIHLLQYLLIHCVSRFSTYKSAALLECVHTSTQLLGMCNASSSIHSLSVRVFPQPKGPSTREGIYRMTMSLTTQHAQIERDTPSSNWSPKC